ncbi:hypothetical protein B0H14DRAFT_3453885 [Mycena olivaceomarginata]|nr:hypothetical protein B0H14DRAFT_3453885 [Mycena olivaceomarginata]
MLHACAALALPFPFHYVLSAPRRPSGTCVPFQLPPPLTDIHAAASTLLACKVPSARAIQQFLHPSVSVSAFYRLIQPSPSCSVLISFCMRRTILIHTGAPQSPRRPIRAGSAARP